MVHGAADRGRLATSRERDPGGRALPEARDHRADLLEEENRRLNQLLADLTLDKQMLQEALRKNW